MRFISLLLIYTVLLSACSEQPSSTGGVDSQKSAKTGTAPESNVETVSETEKLNAWFEEQYEAELMQSPIALTFQGRKERYNEVDDMSEAAEAKNLEWKRRSVSYTHLTLPTILLV